MNKQEMLEVLELSASFPVSADKIISVELAANANDEPVARMLVHGDDVVMCEWLLTDAPHISVFNEFLNTLNLGVEVKFENFKQYAELLMTCDKLIHEHRSEQNKPQ
jgi:hypothetical protein